jgi:murein DD-endopeptidase MepM/ murein hydrolase activator NlpD
MGAPLAVAAALGKSRSGRKAAKAVLVSVALAIALVLTPLAAIPFAVSGSATTAAVADAEAMPTVVGDWGYPLKGSYSTGRGFGWHPVEDCAFCPADHLGYDMDQPCGATIYAAGPGRVINAGAMPGWGNTVRIDHGGGLVTLYGHMAWESIRVAVGQEVTAGTPLGDEGSTGKSTGCHLHFEVQKFGTAVDPEPFMAALGLPLR